MLAFAPAASSGEILVYDDDHYVRSGPVTRGDLGHILDPSASRAELGSEYLPVRDLTWALEARLLGLAPLHELQRPFEDPGWVRAGHVFRATNVALYALACALAWAFLRELTRDEPLAFLAAAFFAVHPVHAESVAWIASRKDVLSGALGFAALAGHVVAWRRPFVAPVAWLLALAAMLSKTTLLALPLLVALVEVLGPAIRREREAVVTGRVWPPEEALWRRRFLRVLPYVVLALVIAVNVIRVGEREGIKRPPPHGGLLTTLATDAPILVRYVAASFLPVDLRVSYATFGLLRPWEGRALVNGAVLAGIAALAGLAWRRRPKLLAFAAVWFVLGLTPVLNFVPFVQLIGDRFLFLPVLGPCLVAAWLVIRLRGAGRGISAIVAASILLGLAPLAVQRGLDFASSTRLFRQNLALEPENPVAHHQLGRALLEKAEAARRARKDGLAKAYASGAAFEEREALRLFAARQNTVAVWAGPVKEAGHSLARALELEGNLVAAVECERDVLAIEFQEARERFGVGAGATMGARQQLLRLGHRAARAVQSVERDADLILAAARCYASAEADELAREIARRVPEEKVAAAVARDADLRRALRRR